MSKISITLAVLGLGIGYAMTPEYKIGMYDKSSMDLGKADRWIDLRYVNAMIAHHRGAMLLAEQAKDVSKRQEITGLAEKILADEPAAIAELYAWKKEWYGDTRIVADPVVPNLGTYDEKFDLRFLNALIAHHDSGLMMTDEVKTKSSRIEVLNNADAVDTFLTNTLDIFKKWRSDWYSI
jgi:uncharacterized protein (DUF305 family)